MSRILPGPLILCLTIGSTPASAAQPPHQQILVYAAASLSDAMQEICSDYQETAQIEEGAPADVFFSAEGTFKG